MYEYVVCSTDQGQTQNTPTQSEFDRLLARKKRMKNVEASMGIYEFHH